MSKRKTSLSPNMTKIVHLSASPEFFDYITHQASKEFRSVPNYIVWKLQPQQYIDECQIEGYHTDKKKGRKH